MAMPVILKGDTSARISFVLTDNFSYEGYTLRVDFHHVSYVIYDLKAGSTVSVQYTAEDTSRFPLGTSLMTLTLENEEGVRRTLPVERVKVTDAPAEVYDGAIIIDPGVAKVEELPERFTDNDVRSKINQILSFLRRCAAFCLLGIMSYGFVAASVLTAPKGEIYNDSPVVTNVNLEGLAKTDEVIPRKVEGHWEAEANHLGLRLRHSDGYGERSVTIMPDGFTVDNAKKNIFLHMGGLHVGERGYQEDAIIYNGRSIFFPSVSKDETFAVKSDVEKKVEWTESEASAISNIFRADTDLSDCDSVQDAAIRKLSQLLGEDVAGY